MTINSSDPFSTPLIDPGLLSNGVDIAVLREGIRSARRFASAPAWSSYITGPSPTNNATTDADLEEYIRNNAVSFFHPVATTAMSSSGADWGVVNPDLKVKNTLGLRIVDAGVIVSVLVSYVIDWLLIVVSAVFTCCARQCACLRCRRKGCRHHSQGVWDIILCWGCM